MYVLSSLSAWTCIYVCVCACAPVREHVHVHFMLKALNLRWININNKSTKSD